ncbi:AraC family transcriptional regulator [Marinobacter sp. SS21]|uniref:AraC family transcriptional regulator n=1 Tax=Marinobacter sp. SS21 TaxID=2979460 RepID=UPI00232B1C53|nr:AraC family transcriptional regulator [Marinobacter sp. SS21]MDC0664135.1 AraC family transcriptional regulator [Marinobacter sp. SS21]
MLTSNQEKGGELDADLERLRQRLASTIERWTPNQQVQETVVPGLHLFRSDSQTSCTASVYEPSVCFIAQGTKSVSFGDRELIYQPLTYMVSSVHLPVLGRILDASPEKPYLAFKIVVDPQDVSNLVLEMGDQLPPEAALGPCPEGDCALSMATMDRGMLDAVTRLIGLLDAPQDIPVVAPLARKEILYRTLIGEMGPRMRKFAVADSSVNRVSRVIALLTDRYTETLRIKALADEVNMSESALFHTFKQVTRMSPLQFQKKLRLHEARRLMLAEGLEAATASYRVGYESPSHFSREYSRLFGAPPRADVSKLRGEQATPA